jgi:hypothetical protein
MALRYVEMLTNTNYWQPLRLKFNAPVVVTPQAQGNQILARREFIQKETQVQLAAQYSQTGDSINLIAYLQKVSPYVLKAGSCTFTVSELLGDGTWSAAQTDIISGTENLFGEWTAIVPAGDLISNVCMGKSTLKIKASLVQVNKTFTKEIFVNHLGIGEAAQWMRNRLNYVEATKRDE